MQLSCWINISPTEESVTNLTGMSFPAKGIHVCRFPPLRRFLQNTSQWQRQRTRTSFAVAPYTPHVMRHTTATHLIEAGVPLAVVKNILGHSSIQTTQIYLDISQQTVDRSMEKWNKKWFAKNSPDESALLQEKKSIPDFLW